MRQVLPYKFSNLETWVLFLSDNVKIALMVAFMCRVVLRCAIGVETRGAPGAYAPPSLHLCCSHFIYPVLQIKFIKNCAPHPQSKSLSYASVQLSSFTTCRVSFNASLKYSLCCLGRICLLVWPQF